IISITIILLTELTSNLATTATFIPIVASIATGMNENILLFVIPATVAASCAFMLPVGTPPNAIIFSSNKIKISDMIKTGIYMNFASIIIIMTIIYLVLPFLINP
ncbi:MAG: anion transporter, partial [Ignavibacteriales bacterium CG_4_9_14_3_um_filter_34_10]